MEGLESLKDDDDDDDDHAALLPSLQTLGISSVFLLSLEGFDIPARVVSMQLGLQENLLMVILL